MIVHPMYIQKNEHPGKLIKIVLKKNNCKLKFDQVSKLIGISGYTLSRLYSGRIKITENLANKISNFMKTVNIRPRIFTFKNYWIAVYNRYLNETRETFHE